MILFGFAGVVTSFTRHFFGVATSEAHISAVAGRAIGLFYVVSGLLTLTKRKWAVGVVIVWRSLWTWWDVLRWLPRTLGCCDSEVAVAHAQMEPSQADEHQHTEHRVPGNIDDRIAAADRRDEESQ